MSEVYTQPYWNGTIDDTNLAVNKVYSNSKTQSLLDWKIDKINGQEDYITVLDSTGWIKQSDKRVTDLSFVNHNHTAAQMVIDNSDFGGGISPLVTNVQELADYMDDTLLTIKASHWDMLKSENLLGLYNYATARSNLWLWNVDNTSDINKPVSTAQASADANILNEAKAYTDWLIIWRNPDLYKYSIVTSVSEGNLTVSLKNYLWQTPSVEVPVKVQIWDTVRTINYDISIVMPKWEDYFHSWGLELRDREVDYFVYLFWYDTNTTPTVWIWISRVIWYKFWDLYYNWPIYDEKKLNYTWNGYSDPTTTNDLVNIWRFNAILSGFYNWSIPSTSIIINRPIYETRELSFNPATTLDSWTFSNFNNFSKYQIVNNRVMIKYTYNYSSISWSAYSTINKKPIQDNYWTWAFHWYGDHYASYGHRQTLIGNNWSGEVYMTRVDWWILDNWTWSFMWIFHCFI